MRRPLIAGIAGALLLLPAAGATSPVTLRVSVDSSGAQANGRSGQYPAISADGCSVAFSSVATNLVAGDTNGQADIFVRDCRTGSTTRVNVDGAGMQANAISARPGISADGRFVSFSSRASNLVPGDTNNAEDVFVHDRESGATTRVSVAEGDVQANSFSQMPVISANGRHVAFQSGASNLVPGDTNSIPDIFVHDRATETTTRVSVSSEGAQANNSAIEPSISADGRVVTFFSPASNLVAGDTNFTYDAFAHDRLSGTTVRASISSGGVQGDNFTFFTAVSGDGNSVAFQSLAENLVSGDTNGNFDIFVHDLRTGTTTRVSVASDGTQGNGGSHEPALSFDGRLVAFWSHANNLVAGDTNISADIFVHDRGSGSTARASVASGGAQANASSFEADLGADGRFLAYRSVASNLVGNDTNSTDDIFLAAPRPRPNSSALSGQTAGALRRVSS